MWVKTIICLQYKCMSPDNFPFEIISISCWITIWLPWADPSQTGARGPVSQAGLQLTKAGFRQWQHKTLQQVCTGWKSSFSQSEKCKAGDINGRDFQRNPRELSIQITLKFNGILGIQIPYSFENPSQHFLLSTNKSLSCMFSME